MQAALLLLFYGLALGGGVMVAARVRIDSLLGRVLIAVTWGAAEILFATQALSLFHQLRAVPLFGAVFALTVITWLVVRGLPTAPLTRPPSVGRLLGLARADPFAFGLLAVSAVAVAGLGILHAQVIPLGDPYHFCMPLYWKQHASILPFAVANPRITGVALGSEALCFPGVLYAGSWAPFVLLTAGAKGLLAWAIIEIALRLGASMGASVTTGAVFLGYAPFAGALPDFLLAYLWFAGAIFFLVEAKTGRSDLQPCLGASLFCALMACGAKNIIFLAIPVYLLFGIWLLGRPIFAWRSVRSLMVAGALGLLCSTSLWIYTSNYLWFGNARGPKLLQETLARDFDPAAIWTRTVRCAVVSFTDPLWLPKSIQPAYGNLLKKGVHLLGGRDVLAEDDAYYAFIAESLRPGVGFGPLGFCVFLPGMAWALVVTWRKRDERWLSVAFVCLAIGCFVITCMFLRTQRVGLPRFMGASLIAGAPLAAFMLEKRWIRLAVALPLLAALACYTVASAGAVVRRLENPSWLATQISRLQNNHKETLDYRWSDANPGHLTIREDFSLREVYALLLTRVPPGSSCAFMSSFNSEETYLFGPDFSNRVFSLHDYRHAERPLPIPAEVTYVVSEAGDFPGLDYQAAGFAPWLEVSRAGTPMFAVLKRQ